MDHLLIYNRPLLDGLAGRPALLLVGQLPDYEPGVDYIGRLQIQNAIGDCTGWLVDGVLPPGHAVWIDNDTKELVLEWPGYILTPPPVPDPPPVGLFNGDIEQGVKGWKLGPGWYVKDTAGAGVVGTKALACTDPGVSASESDAVRCDTGTSITASALWYQGPSNKKNVDLYTQLVWYDANMREISVSSGNKVHDQSNTSSHISSVTASAPAGTWKVAVRLLMYRRRYAREVVVDQVTWNHFMRSPEVETTPDQPETHPEDFPIILAAKDSAGRIAYWSGLLSYQSVYVTSKLYGIIAEEHLGVGFAQQDFVFKVGAIDAGLSEAANVGYSLQGFLFSSPVQTYGASEPVVVGYALSSWSFRTPLVPYSHAEAVGVNYALTAWKFKQHPITESSDAASVAYSLTSWTIT